MPSAEEHSGLPLVGPRFEVPIERGKVYEFTRAVGSSHPAHLQPQAPVIPATFLTTAGFFWGYSLETPGDNPFSGFDIDRSLLLHAEEEYEFYGTVPVAGETLVAQSQISDVTRKRGKRGGELVFVVLETEFRASSGQVVARSRTTVVQTEKPAS
jgi:hypothetical protein